MRLTEVHLTREEIENLRGRFFLQVDRPSDGCWPWTGPRHSSGAGRYLWRKKDGGNDRYIGAHRLAYYLSTGELPSYLRNLCGNRLCCKASHWWTKPTGGWKPKPMKATRGRVRRLPASDIERIRLLASLGSDEAEIGEQFGLNKRQVVKIAMGRVRPDVGGRIRSSRFRGIRFYHRQFEEELLSMRPEEPVFRRHQVVSQPQVVRQPEVVRTPSNPSTGCPVPLGRPFPATSYGQAQGRRLPSTGRC